jgi:long-chain acyl-CoA synthetase
MSNLIKEVFVYVFMFLTRVIVMSYTFVTLPLYYILQKPWKKLEISRNCGAHQSDPNSTSSEWIRQVEIPYHPLMDCNTASEAFNKVMELYPLDKPTLGYREVLAEEVQHDKDGNPIKVDGKVLRKYKLSDYKWLTLGEVGKRVDHIGRGLMVNGLMTGDRVAIYAETGVQWFLVSTAITKVGGVLVTVFHTLNDDGLLHALNETKVTHLITSFEFISRVSSLMDRLPFITTIVYFEGLYCYNFSLRKV